jgi:hypothetical protein
MGWFPFLDGFSCVGRMLSLTEAAPLPVNWTNSIMIRERDCKSGFMGISVTREVVGGVLRALCVKYPYPRSREIPINRESKVGSAFY